jgi:hypothetical protein
VFLIVSAVRLHETGAFASVNIARSDKLKERRGDEDWPVCPRSFVIFTEARDETYTPAHSDRRKSQLEITSSVSLP